MRSLCVVLPVKQMWRGLNICLLSINIYSWLGKGWAHLGKVNSIAWHSKRDKETKGAEATAVPKHIHLWLWNNTELLADASRKAPATENCPHTMSLTVHCYARNTHVRNTINLLPENKSWLHHCSRPFDYKITLAWKRRRSNNNSIQTPALKQACTGKRPISLYMCMHKNNLQKIKWETSYNCLSEYYLRSNSMSSQQQ